MLELCSKCPYNVNEYCIMFDDVLGFENCVFRKDNVNEVDYDTH